MRVARRNWLLAAVWLVLLVLTWTTGGPGSRLPEREVGRLFPDFTGAGAERVVLERGAEVLELLRAEAAGEAGDDPGAGWVLPAHFDHPANAATVRQLFDAVTSLTNLDLLSEDPASHADYGVDDGLTVRLLGADGVLLAGFVQGGDASTGTGLASYVRPLGVDEVYRAPRVGPIPLDPLRWLDRQWVVFQPALVRALTVAHDGQASTWERADMERWTRDGSPASARLVRAFLDRVAALFFDEVVARGPAERGLEEPGDAALQLVLVLQDGTRHTLSFAEPDAEGTREAWLGPEDPVVRFSAASSALLSRSVRALEEGL